MEVTLKDGKLVISIPVNKQPTASKSGKTLIVASTGGFVTSPVSIGGKPVKIAVNAVIGK